MKIYTYANPFTLECEPYWDEIKSAPHFCVSHTLVQGLCRHYGRHSFKYICTADRIVNALYPEWYQDVELKIEQYVSVSRQIESVSDGKLAKALKFNQQSFVDALRFAVTLDLDTAGFNKAALPREQQVFLDILSNLRDMPCWKYENNPEKYKDRLGAAIESIYRTEMDETLATIISENDLKLPEDASPADRMYACLEYLGAKTDEAAVRQRKVLEHYTALSINPQFRNIDKVVFHAIHQFTPKILSAVKALDNAGIEVVFLFNYQGTYRHVYDTWVKVYEWTGCRISERTRSDSFECRLIGECIGHLLDGRRSGDVRLESTVLEYQNRTEFSDHVADCFSAAVSKSKAISLALSNMDEQFYGVRSDAINEILKFYFPEQFGDRHFLSYPIGQFILSLYSMWDEHAGLIFNDTLIRECLSVNIWGFHGTATPISVYEKIKGFFGDLSELNAIIERLEYLKATIVRIGSVESNPIFAEFPFFSLSEYDVGYFIDILMDIKSIADELFVKESGRYINFREHFKRLISMIGMRMTGNKYVSDQERQLVGEVQNRLSSLKTSRPIVGNIDDLKQTIHYYLQNESEDKSANWIVRNFEQIDGGVLLSPYTRAKTYHLALLSDRNMKQRRDEFFPWPLTAEMLESQREISQDSKTILTSYKEYRNFLRYCVFYGTYYLDTRKHIQFSYVEESDADKDIPYYILTLLGLKVVSPDIAEQCEREHTPDKRIDIDEEELNRHIDLISKPEQEVFVSCPYRFLLSHVLEEKSCFSEEFDSRRLYSLLLFSETWQKNAGIPAAEIKNRMLAESERLKGYFPFWKTVDYVDLENTAYHYLNNRDMIKRGCLQEYHPNYIRRKTTFKDSRSKITKPFEYKSEIMRAYLRSTPYREPVKPPVGEAELLCRACNQRNVCMRKYLLEE